MPSIWAVGDVAGPYQFTHWANYQARTVIRNALFPGSWACDFDTVPWTTFTEPEVARVGLSEAEARPRGVVYDLFTASFEDNDRALCDGEPEGFVKVLSTPIHVYPTLAEANRADGDAYLRGRLRPWMRRALSALFAWRRR